MECKSHIDPTFFGQPKKNKIAGSYPHGLRHIDLSMSYEITIWSGRYDFCVSYGILFFWPARRGKKSKRYGVYFSYGKVISTWSYRVVRYGPFDDIGIAHAANARVCLYHNERHGSSIANSMAQK